MTDDQAHEQKAAWRLLRTGILLLWVAFAPACAHQKYSPESVAEAHVAVNAAIARGDLECRNDTYAGSLIPYRVCYFRGERAYRQALSEYYIGRRPAPPRPPLALALRQTTPDLRD